MISVPLKKFFAAGWMLLIEKFVVQIHYAKTPLFVQI